MSVGRNFTAKMSKSMNMYSSEWEIDVYPAGHGGTGLSPSISSFISSPALPPKGGEGVNPLHAFRLWGDGGGAYKARKRWRQARAPMSCSLLYILVCVFVSPLEPVSNNY